MTLSGSRVAPLLGVLAFVGFLTPSLSSQEHKPTYNDLTVVRNRRWAKTDFFEVRAGLMGIMPSGEDATRFAEKDYNLQGQAYYRSSKPFGREGRLEVYAGRDGAYASLVDGNPDAPNKGYSRIEIHGRPWGAFQREGFYDGDNFQAVGFYRMKDWRVKASFATNFAKGLKGEAGAFYGHNSFSRSSQTAPGFTIPPGFKVYGFNAHIEDNGIQIDQQSHLPQKGALFSIWIEREWNDNNDAFGTLGNETSLPAAVMRGGGHMEYYAPYTTNGTWVLSADAAMAAEDDRIFINDAGKPIGKMWVDGRIDYRLLLGDHLTLTPGFRAQWVKVAGQFGTGTDTKFFFGGQVELRYDFAESFALTAEYSYLSNESRSPISFTKDGLGEHRFFIGFEFRP